MDGTDLRALEARLLRAERRFRPLGFLAFVAVLGAVTAASSRPVLAQGKSDTSINGRVAALESDVAALKSLVSGHAAKIASLETANGQLLSRIALVNDDLGTLETELTQVKGKVEALSTGGDGLDALIGQVAAIDTDLRAALLRTSALEEKTKFFGVYGTDLVVSGANVYIQNGLGATTQKNGLGNLIIGYNAPRPGGDVRTGSHNLIVGDQNNYNSTAAAIFGFKNSSLGAYASVLGGSENVASGLRSVVAGGWRNKSAGDLSSALGGDNNAANGTYSSVSGGQSNSANGDYASVTAGYMNTATGGYSAISGGFSNSAAGPLSSISGGQYGAQAANYGWRGGSYSSP